MAPQEPEGTSEVAVALVVAAARNGVIGRDGGLPWRIPSDLKTFRRMTMGKPVVMGRRTFQSIGRALDGRANIVVTRDPAFAAPDGVTIARDVDAALALARRIAAREGAPEVAVIGGAQVYDAARAGADVIYLTRVEAEVAGDTTFADPDPAQWELTGREPIAADPRDQFPVTLEIWRRRGSTA